MTINVPPSTNYPSPLNAVPANFANEPTVGNQIIPIEIDWSTMGGSASNGNKGVYFNLQNNATLEFDCIRTISIDNSACGADIEIVFTDTSETIQIPAYTPKAIIPAFTNGTQFYVIGYNTLTIDVTRMSIMNFAVPPVVIPISREQNNAVAVAASVGVTPVIPASVIGGTVENINVTWDAIPNASINFTWALDDGTGKVLAQGIVSSATGQTINNLLLTLTDVNLRFQNGVNLGISAGGAGNIVVNLYYRTP